MEWNKNNMRAMMMVTMPVERKQTTVIAIAILDMYNIIGRRQKKMKLGEKEGKCLWGQSNSFIAEISPST